MMREALKPGRRVAVSRIPAEPLQVVVRGRSQGTPGAGAVMGGLQLARGQDMEKRGGTIRCIVADTAIA